MINSDVLGSGLIELEHFVTDYSGTLSEDGKLIPGIKEKLNALSESLEVHALTSDTFGMAKAEFDGVNCKLHVLSGEDHISQKERYILELGPEKVAALGNGNNDELMLKAAQLGIAVCMKEGCSARALQAADIFAKSPIDAIELFLNPKRLIATLRI